MPTYHNNQLTVVGPDSDDDSKLYTPTKSTNALKRKRTHNSKMSGASGNGGGDDHGDKSEFPPPEYAFGGEHFAPYSAYDTGDITFPNLLSLPDAYGDDGGNYGQLDDPSLSLYSAPPSSDVYTFPTYAYGFPAELNLHGHHDDIKGSDEQKDETQVKDEEEARDYEEVNVSPTPAGESEDYESDYEERRPSKAPKINKDGAPRKPRQPRAKLLKWDDNDWKNVALGLVWACGESGLQIPFDQASQVVSESCTAGALQQALLKLRGKQISEGYQIPQLKMAWTRKNKKSDSTTSSANSSKGPQLPDSGTLKNPQPRKKPTRFVGNQSYIVTLKCAYKEADRSLLALPRINQGALPDIDPRQMIHQRLIPPLLNWHAGLSEGGNFTFSPPAAQDASQGLVDGTDGTMLSSATAPRGFNGQEYRYHRYARLMPYDAGFTPPGPFDNTPPMPTRAAPPAPVKRKKRTSEYYDCSPVPFNLRPKEDDDDDNNGGSGSGGGGMGFGGSRDSHPPNAFV